MASKFNLFRISLGCQMIQISIAILPEGFVKYEISRALSVWAHSIILLDNELHQEKMDLKLPPLSTMRH